MKSNLTFHTPDRPIWSYAFAGSLVLHAGLLAVCYGWLWEILRPPQSPPSKSIPIKMVLPPSKIMEKNLSSQTLAGSPALPQAIRPLSAASLQSRTPAELKPPGRPLKPVPRVIFRNPRSRSPSPNQRTSSVLKPGFRPLAPNSFPANHPVAGRKVSIRVSANTVAEPLSAVYSSVAAHSMANKGQMVVRPRTPYSKSDLSKKAGEGSTILVKAGPRTPRPSASLRHPAPVSPAYVLSPPRPIASPISGNSGPEDSGVAGLASLSVSSNRNPSKPDEEPGEGMGRLRGAFTRKVRQQIAQAKFYPRIARRRGLEGRPVVTFTLSKKGRLTGVELAETSGYTLLDNAALEAVRNAAPYPEIPEPLNTDSIQFKLPVSFTLK